MRKMDGEHRPHHEGKTETCMEAVLPSCANPVNHIPVIEFAETNDVTKTTTFASQRPSPTRKLRIFGDERAAEARANRARRRASLKGASQCLSGAR